MSKDKQLVDPHHKPMGGEIPGVRGTRDRMTQHLIEQGNASDYARRKATEAAQRFHRSKD